ncbi:MAG: DUF692 domain-containing protein [Bermanella sp.]
MTAQHINVKSKDLTQNPISIGVGLRHAHYADVLAQPSDIDFIEVHSENFFANGGASRSFLREVAKLYPISLHSTALGLGSYASIPGGYLDSLKALVEEVNPILMSDHAAFAWGEFNQQPMHAGDLLPVAFDQKNLAIMAKNIDRAQQLTGRKLKVENLSAYLVPSGSSMSETEFLVKLTQLTGCELLIDLNNLVVNANNFSNLENTDYSKQWLSQIPTNLVGELHLAGFTPVATGELTIDDHSQPVSDTVWELYEFALQRFGSVPTLVEWDNNLPSWNVLVGEASKARKIARQVLNNA